jgi:hypothetical protein
MMRRDLYTHAGIERSQLFSFGQTRCGRVVAAVFRRIEDSKFEIPIGKNQSRIFDFESRIIFSENLQIAPA